MDNRLTDRDMSFLPLQKKYRLCGFPLGKKYRSHFEIIALMIEAVKDGGQGKFSVMKHASINCGQFDRFVGALSEMGFVEECAMNGRPLYRASERGLAFLRQYYVLLSMFLIAEDGARRSTIMYEAHVRQQ